MGSEQENRQAVERLWQLFEARDWQRAGQELHDDFTAYYPHTGEIFRGRENFIAINENFPPLGDWHINIKRIVANANLVVSEVVVTHDYGLSYAASFFELKDGKIHSLTEYWVEAGSEEPPEWRKQWVERIERPPTYYGAEDKQRQREES
jgi:ketosteroid isomerase-like protein